MDVSVSSCQKQRWKAIIWIGFRFILSLTPLLGVCGRARCSSTSKRPAGVALRFVNEAGEWKPQSVGLIELSYLTTLLSS